MNDPLTIESLTQLYRDMAKDPSAIKALSDPLTPVIKFALVAAYMPEMLPSDDDLHSV